MENIFIEMLKESIDDLRSGKLPKGKFIGKYMERLNKEDSKSAFRFKRPQVIGEGKEPNNNWVDYILGLSDEEYIYFKQALNG
jgi:hypothetical protein